MMNNILLSSYSPLGHAIIGAIGAFITYLLYLGISFLLEYIKGGKNKKKDNIVMAPNNGIEIEPTDSTEDIISEERGQMYCRYCGKRIEKDAIFCSHCGKKQSLESQMNPQINNLVGWSKNISVKVRKMLYKPFSYMKGINLRSIKVGKWGKRSIIVVIFSVIILGLLGLGSWIYNDFYLPYHYESLYEEGMKDVNKADEIALELFEAGYYRQYETKAIEVLTNSAEKGNVKSMVLLGRYYKGYDIKIGYADGWKSGWQKSESFDKGSYWYLQAAKLGNAEAQGELGHNYKYGFGVKQDFDKAIYWTKQGADNGDAVAQWRMGNLYKSGLAYYWGNFTDYQIWWYNGNGFIAKDNPKVDLDRQYIADMKRRGPETVFLSPNIKKAKYYWKLAANQGFKEAKKSLEKIYEGDD